MNKADQRKEARAKRRLLSQTEQRDYSQTASRLFFELIHNGQIKTALSYMPMKNELDPSTLDRLLSDKGVSIAYPLCCDDFSLKLLIPKDNNAFNVGAYGILEPDTSRSKEISPSDLDLIIVPLVAFDEAKNRLGQGAGYYDRLLKQTNALKIGIAFECQKVDKVICEEHDIKLDFIVTEKAVY